MSYSFWLMSSSFCWASITLRSASRAERWAPDSASRAEVAAWSAEAAFWVAVCRSVVALVSDGTVCRPNSFNSRPAPL